MKQITQTSLLLLISVTTFGQTLFIPSRPEHVSETDFRKGEQILKNAYQQIADDNYNMVAGDYWNFATAYSKMGQTKELVYDFLYKSKHTNPKEFCEIATLYHSRRNGMEHTAFYNLLKEDYRQLVSDCSATMTEEKFDIEGYITANNYDSALIYELNELLTEDQKWRKGKDKDLEKTIVADKTNISKAEEIIKKYGYPGTNMAGQKFESVIFLVIQHADLPYQEKYLPLIAKAVEEQQLSKAALRMLLDRIYTRKTGVQLFGSQVGVSFSDDKTIEQVKLKYKL